MLFNGISKDYFFIRSKRRPFFAPLNRSFTDIDSQLLSTERGPRLLPVLTHFEFSDFQHFERLKEETAEWLVHEEAKVLTFSDDPDRFYWAVIDSIDYGDELPTAADVTINFICGYKYSLQRSVHIDTDAEETIKGHKPTPWKTRTLFTSDETGYELRFNTPGKSSLREIGKIILNHNFIMGDVLEIDYLKRRVTLNGSDITNTLVILQSNFMELPIGKVQFESSFKTEFFYHERYY